MRSEEGTQVGNRGGAKVNLTLSDVTVDLGKKFVVEVQARTCDQGK